MFCATCKTFHNDIQYPVHLMSGWEAVVKSYKSHDMKAINSTIAFAFLLKTCHATSQQQTSDGTQTVFELFYRMPCYNTAHHIKYHKLFLHHIMFYSIHHATMSCIYSVSVCR